MRNPWLTRRGIRAQLILGRAWAVLPDWGKAVMRDDARKWLKVRGWNVAYIMAKHEYQIQQCVNWKLGWFESRGVNVKDYDAALIAAMLLAQGKP